MLREWFDKLRGASKPTNYRFEPLYDPEQLVTCGKLPIVRVLAFAGESGHTSPESIGPGVGGILASLLRRDLTFTRRLSALGGEDTGYLQPDGRDLDDEELLDTFASSTAIVAGQVQREDDSQFRLRIRAVRRDSTGPHGRFTLRFKPSELASLMPTTARAVCKHLGIDVAPQAAERWRQHGLMGWSSLLAAGTCWEENDSAKLADLFKAGKVHPDAIVSIDCDGPWREVAHDALSRANSIEPDNPQLAFCTFCALCNFNRPPIEPRFEAMLRAGLAAGPGHGKSHMVLAHVIAALSENIPYILGHSEVGYRLLPGNTFALSNFSSHLMHVAPYDERILPLACEAIDFDPQNPSGYQNVIQFLVRCGRTAAALPFAEKLVEICTPPVSERTMYCFRQYPDVAEMMDRGSFSPHRFATEILAHCRATANPGTQK